jgi:hypothetical protein
VISIYPSNFTLAARLPALKAAYTPFFLLRAGNLVFC